MILLPQKLLFVIDYFRDPHAGTEGQLFNLIAGLDRQLFEPHLLVFSDSVWLQQQGFPCAYSVLGHRSLKSPQTWLSLWQAARRFRREGMRLAHVFFNDPSLICPPVFRLAGIQTLISRRDMGYWYTPLLKRLLGFTGRFALGVVVNSLAVKQATMQAEGFADEQVHVIYNGYPEPDSATRSAQANPIDPLAALKQQGRLLMGLVANIRPIKRMQDAVAALGLLRQDVPALDLVIIGAGDASYLWAQAASLGIESRVHFLGARSDVKACLGYLDIALLCSESEGFSNAIVEYLQAGLPVVCSAVGGNPEAIVQGENGYLFPMGDVAAFAAAIHQVAANDALREQLSVQARRSAARYSMSAMVDAHEDLYRSLLG